MKKKQKSMNWEYIKQNAIVNLPAIIQLVLSTFMLITWMNVHSYLLENTPAELAAISNVIFVLFVLISFRFPEFITYELLLYEDKE